MKKSCLLCIAILAAAAVSCGKDATAGLPGVGDPLPQFSVVLSDGTAVSDRSLRGDASLLVFFGPGCPDCKWQFDRLQELVDGWPGICPVVAVSRGLADRVPSYMEENGYTFPWSAQKDRTLYERFSDRGIPSMYISDRDGVIRYVHFDDSMAEKETLKAEIENARSL